ncbi:MAG: protein kinase [Acidobacteria bacterium]|nr:protein kinase [Acidobacteriota bacterium]
MNGNQTDPLADTHPVPPAPDPGDPGLIRQPDGIPPRYEVRRRLGSGSFGEVFYAWDRRLERAVCVKVLRKDVLGDGKGDEAKQRFLREAQAAARLQHRHIVTVHDVVEQDGRLAIIMEYVEGETLRDLMQRRGPLDVPTAVRIIGQIGSALAFAHAGGVIHRDLKPANVFLAQDGTVKLGDFGTARVMDKATLTHSDSLIGTPAYMAPEMIRGESVDGRTDIYALGCMAYEMIAGQRPFTDPNLVTVLFQVMHEPPPSLRQRVPDVPAWLDAAVAKAMAKSPADRQQRVEALLADLGAEVPTAGTDIRPAVPTRARWKWAAVAAVAAAAATACWWVFWSGSPRPVAVAIMPFVNETGQSEFNFVTQGLAAELSRLYPVSGAVSVVPIGDLAQGPVRPEEVLKASRARGADFIQSGRLLTRAGTIELEYRLMSTAGSRLWTDRIPLSAGNLQTMVRQVYRQNMTWLDLPPANPEMEINPTAYELYLKGIGKIQDMSHGEAGAFEEAKAFLERGLQIEPSVTLYAGLAELHFQAVNTWNSLEPDSLSYSRYYLEKGRSLQPDYGPLLRLSVLLDIQQGRMEEAMQTLVEQFRADRLELMQFNQAATIFRLNGDHEAASALIQYALSLYPDHDFIRLSLVRNLTQTGRTTEARKMLEKLLRDSPQYYFVRLDYIRLAMMSGDIGTADRLVKNMPELLPSRAIRHQVACLQGDCAPFDPSERFRRVAKLDYDLSLVMAECFSMSGQTDEAMKFMQQTVDIGFTDWSYFDRNPLLANVRRTPEYQTLRKQGLVNQRSRRLRERALIQPVLDQYQIVLPPATALN